MTTPQPLPTKEDFNPWGPDNLDAEHAWQCFGNLTLDEAHARFCECPELYHEDFMFMGGKAYAFYFPVIERFLYEVTEVADVPDDREAWILACGIQKQLRVDTALARGETFEMAIKIALKAVMVSPHFLYLIEDEPVISEYQLASRLAAFLCRFQQRGAEQLVGGGGED